MFWRIVEFWNLSQIQSTKFWNQALVMLILKAISSVKSYIRFKAQFLEPGLLVMFDVNFKSHVMMKSHMAIYMSGDQTLVNGHLHADSFCLCNAVSANCIHISQSVDFLHWSQTKCTQCEFAPSQARDVKTYRKMRVAVFFLCSVFLAVWHLTQFAD